MIWLIDNGPLVTLAAKLDDAWVWPADVLHVAEQVAEEGRNDFHAPRLLGRVDEHGATWIRRHDFTASSSAGQLLAELRSDGARTQRNLGEDVSIALCLTELQDAVFVTDDNRAAFLALQELGPSRVSTSFDLWIWLGNRSLISADTTKALCEASRRKLNHRKMPVRIDALLGGLPT